MVVGYLRPSFDATAHQVTQILAAESAPRHLFQDGSGFVSPLWERATGIASVALILVGLPFGLFVIWRHHRSNAATLALAVVTLGYPISQAIRVSPSGVTLAGRAPAYLFPEIAFVLGIGVIQFWLADAPSWRRFAMVTSAITVIFVGGWVVGTGPLWNRLPGPYMVSAMERSMTPEGVSAAEWARAYLGPDHRLVGDWTNRLLMATYGDEWPVSAANEKFPDAMVFTSLSFGPYLASILRRQKVPYLLVDRRLSTSLPRNGYYFDDTEPDAFHYTRPLDPLASRKFDGVNGVSRVFDSGNIIIYDVGGLTMVSSIASAPRSAGRPIPPSVLPTPLPMAALPPKIRLFDLRMSAGGAAALVWTVTGATDVRLDGRRVPPAGRKALPPLTATLTLELTAQNPAGTVSRFLRLEAPITAYVPGQPATHRGALLGQAQPRRSGAQLALHVSLLPRSVRPGDMVRIVVSSAPSALVHLTVSLPGHQPLSFYDVTDGHGRLTVAMRVPRDILLHGGRATVPVAVQTISGAVHAQASPVLTIFDDGGTSYHQRPAAARFPMQGMP
jgi:hypothetical protein